MRENCNILSCNLQTSRTDDDLRRPRLAFFSGRMYAAGKPVNRAAQKYRGYFIFACSRERPRTVATVFIYVHLNQFDSDQSPVFFFFFF